MMEKRKRKQSS